MAAPQPRSKERGCGALPRRSSRGAASGAAVSGTSARAGALFRGTSSSCSEPRTVRGQLLLSLGEELRERSKQVPRSSSAVRVSSDEDTQRAIDRTRLAERGERLNGLDVDAEAECRSRIDPSRSPARRFDCVPRSESESPASSREIPRAPFVPRWRALRSTKDPAPGCFRPASRTTDAPSRAARERGSCRRRSPRSGRRRRTKIGDRT